MSHLSPQHVQFEDSSDEDRDVCVHVNTSLSSPDNVEDVVHSVITTDNGEHSLVVRNGYPSSSTPDMEEQSQEESDKPVDGWLPSPRRYSDTIELGIYRSHSFDPNLFNIREVSPDKIAEQLTLIDLALLKGIRREEFANCSWTKKDKQTLAPNIVAFSQRFNHTSFLVVRDILNESNVKLRAEIVVHFIRVSRRLQELNNLHSLVAVVSALQSPPILRLQQTWKNVPKKDKNHFDRLTEFISEEENYCHLREHIHALPTQGACIPHLGLHQRDLVYLDSLSKHSNISEEDCTRYVKETEKILFFIECCQNSKYDNLMPNKSIQKYLKSVLYIDELQKFFEDDNYKMSLQREPLASNRKQHSVVDFRHPAPPRSHPSHHPLRNSKSQEDLTAPLKPEYTGPVNIISTIGTPPPRRPLSSRYSESDIGTPKKEPFKPPTMQITVPSADKSTASSVKIKGSTLPPNFQPPSGNAEDWRRSQSAEGGKINNHGHLDFLGSKKVKSASPSLMGRRRAGHLKSQSLGNNVLAVLGIGNGKQGFHNSRGGSPDLPQHSTCLLDDSLLDDTFTSTTTGGITTPGSADFFTPPLSTGSSSSVEVSSLNEESEIFLKDSYEQDFLPVNALDDAEVLHDGILKRRVLKKEGKAVQLKFSHDFWVQLTTRLIILLPPKYKNSKKPVKMSKLKGIKLFGSRVRYKDPSVKLKDTQFVIVDDKGNYTKFTAESIALAEQWVHVIRDAIINEEAILRRQEEETPLIRF